jgi:hypothetical protein
MLAGAAGRRRRLKCGAEPPPPVAAWRTSRYPRPVSSARRLLPVARRAVIAVAFVILLLAVALGSAGVIAIWSHPAGAASRAELTWHGDSTLTPELDRAETDLAAVAASVDRLGVLARGAIGALTASQPTAFSDALTEGGTVATTIQGSSTALRARLVGLPGGVPADAIAYGNDVLARRAAMIAALDATGGLGRSWATLTADSLQASQLIHLLGDHDTTVASAATQGRAADYAAALVTLAAASTTLDQAVAIRDQLANAADVSTLDDWVARNRRYDAALIALYTALRDSGGIVNDAVRKAFKEEGDARAQLPPDDRALVVILSDIGRGGLNQAVIAIEQAKGRLNLALETLTSMAVPALGAPSG